MMSREKAGNVLLFVLMVLLIAVVLVFNVRSTSAQETATEAAPVVVTPEADVLAWAERGTNWELIALIITVALIGGSLGYYAIKQAAAGVPAGTIDRGLADQVRQLQSDNRTLIDRLERAYQSENATLKATVDKLHTVLNSFAPLLEWLETDDALDDVLEDIQTPGAPGEPSDAAGAVKINQNFPQG